MADGVFTIAHYRVRPDAEERFTDILRQHEATLRALELITDRPTQTYVGTERGIEGPLFVEIFEWVDEIGVQVAHTHPQVSAVWERIGAACEQRGGRPMFEFPTMRSLESP
ncbi:hypothetical protein [Fodinicola acaciae]|uniref:hypothetical protein n=1 Tax=Fodinicola acaciae TaxID=2681555 RepID=UPI0013D08235|nr:hypothetical protein [Fodinicola acaciae]